MAGYREHISVSGLCGIGYGAGATMILGFTPVQGILAGVLTWVAGMLPDLDSDSGRPVREIFGLMAAAVPLVMMRHLIYWSGGDLEIAIFAAVALYASIKYGLSFLLKKVSVHRGMFHSVPALLIAAEIVFLAYRSDFVAVKLLMAGGVAIGFFSHLLLDELYSVQWTGVRLRLNKAAGSALKMFSRNLAPNVMTYALLFVLTYASLVCAGLLSEPHPGASPDPLRQASQPELGPQ